MEKTRKNLCGLTPSILLATFPRKHFYPSYALFPPIHMNANHANISKPIT